MSNFAGDWQLSGFTRICGGKFRTTCVYFDDRNKEPIESTYSAEWVGSAPSSPDKAGTAEVGFPTNMFVRYSLQLINEGDPKLGLPIEVQGIAGMDDIFMRAIVISPGSASPFIERLMDDIWRLRSGETEADEIRGVPVTRFRIKRLWELDMKDGVTDNRSKEINDHLYQG